MQQVRELIGRYAPTRLPALILGETGTGKELVARALHDQSRRPGRFVALNSPGLTPDLADSELFGHRRGAFTGAVSDKVGAFEAARDGTVFIDEIGDLSLAVQAKLLRVLQEGSFRVVGDMRGEVESTARVVAATWKDLPAMVADGTFRRDLYERLAFCVVAVPPLRDRPQDIPLLADALLERGRREHGLPRCRLTPDAKRLLVGQRWEGNVRGLQRTLFQAALRATGSLLGVADLARVLRPPQPEPSHRDRAASVLQVLEDCTDGVTASELASRLIISTSTVRRTLEPLLSAGTVRRTGRARATRYVLGTAGLSTLPPSPDREGDRSPEGVDDPSANEVGSVEPDLSWTPVIGVADAMGDRAVESRQVPGPPETQRQLRTGDPQSHGTGLRPRPAVPHVTRWRGWGPGAPSGRYLPARPERSATEVAKIGEPAEVGERYLAGSCHPRADSPV